MKKILLFFVVALFSVASFAQETEFEAPDFAKIKKEVNSKKNEYYYPKLLKRFEAADTTMTIEHFRHIYYGAATLPDYEPYGSDLEKELEKVLDTDKPTKSVWKKALGVVNKQLSEDPTNMTFHLYKINISEKVYGDDSKEFINAYNQLTMLFYAILSTGDGTSEETAFYVTCVSDEYTLMKMIGMKPKGQALVHADNGESYDVMDVEDDEGNESKLYFNITIMMEQLDKMFK